MTNINDRLNMEGEPWKPKVGDQLIGRIGDITQRTSDYGTYPIVTITNDQGAWDFHAFHTIPRQEIERRQPAIGDEIGVRYLGKPEGKEYENYRIIIDPKRPAPGTETTDEPF